MPLRLTAKGKRKMAGVPRRDRLAMEKAVILLSTVKVLSPDSKDPKVRRQYRQNQEQAREASSEHARRLGIHVPTFGLRAGH